jgi:hypothetical protein
MILLIAMPTQGEVSTPTVRSLIALTQWLRDQGIAFAFESYEFSDIVFSRNQLMSLFLTRERFTHMLMLDSDMAFQPQAIGRLIGLGEDFTTAAYPQKHPRWQRLRELIEAEAHLPEDERTPTGELLARAWIYNHQIAPFGGGKWIPKRRDGFITVPATGTGLMLLSRAVPERMVEAGAAVPKPRMSDIPLHHGLNYHDFFSHRTAPDGGFMYGEDQSFCMRWTVDCGGEIWLDTDSAIRHVGTRSFDGRYAAKLAEDFGQIDDLD